MSRFGRGNIIALMIASLVAAGAARQWGMSQRSRRVGAVVARTDLNAMDTYALALLLGGLRGPLVMFLWYSSETQKQEHDLADFDTKVEWIRLLQPEFDTVHLFQIWNKAYNISVQMASLPNKYSTILDAIDYGTSVDAQKPDDINIISAIGGVYSDKLGNSNEKDYYGHRVREETQAIQDLDRVTAPAASLKNLMDAAHSVGMDEQWGDIETDSRAGTVSVVMLESIAAQIRKMPESAQWRVSYEPIPRQRIESLRANGVRRSRLDPMLDEQGNILRRYLVPNPADLPAAAGRYDGSELQYLKKFEPFPYGLSPNALGYNYHERAEALQDERGQHHIQTSDMVIDSRAALTLKFWGEDESISGRRAELRLFGMDDEGIKGDLQLRAPDADPNHPVPAVSTARPDPAAGPRALFEYERASRLYQDAYVELSGHIKRFPDTQGRYTSHLDDETAFRDFYQADHDYLAGILDPTHRAEDFKNAALSEHDGYKTGYQAAIEDFDLIILRYYVDDGVAAAVYPINSHTGKRYTHNTIFELPPDQRTALLQAVLDADATYFKQAGHYDGQADEREENLAYIARCGARLKAMGYPTPFPMETVATPKPGP